MGDESGEKTGTDAHYGISLLAFLFRLKLNTAAGAYKFECKSAILS